MQGGYGYPQQGGYGGGGYPPPQQGYGAPLPQFNYGGGGYPQQGYPPSPSSPSQFGGGGGDPQQDMRIKMLELEVQKLQLENQQLRLENQQLKMGGGHQTQGVTPVPTSATGGQGSSNVVLRDAWKLTWDERAGSTAIDYMSGADTGRQTWVKQDQSFSVDFITVGPAVVQLWDLESGQCAKVVSKPEKWKDYRNLGFDVLEDQRLVVIGGKPSFEGNLIMSYNLDTDTWNEIRKDTAEPNFVALHCLPGPQPTVVASEGSAIRLIDFNSGRPIHKFPIGSDGYCDYIRRDPLNPNVFYASVKDKIIMFDKNTKKEVRSFLGLSYISEVQVPVVPGTQLISNDDLKVKIWDVGTGRVIHTINSENIHRSSMYANIVAVTKQYQDVKVFDLLENVTEPAKILPQTYQGMQEIFVTPRKILLTTGYVWTTTPFSA